MVAAAGHVLTQRTLRLSAVQRTAALPQDPITGRAGPSAGLEADLLPRMVNFAVEQYYPEIAAEYPAEADGAVRERARAMFAELVDRTARLVAAWQSVVRDGCGFVGCLARFTCACGGSLRLG